MTTFLIILICLTIISLAMIVKGLNQFDESPAIIGVILLVAVTMFGWVGIAQAFVWRGHEVTDEQVIVAKGQREGVAILETGSVTIRIPIKDIKTFNSLTNGTNQVKIKTGRNLYNGVTSRRIVNEVD